MSVAERGVAERGELARGGSSPALGASPLARLLERLLPSIFAWAHGRLPQRARSRVETEDLVQEAAVGAIQHLSEEKLLSPETVRTYIQVSIRNRIVDEIRRAGKVEIQDHGSGESAPDPNASPLADAIESEDHRRFRRGLAALDEVDQLLIVGRVELGLTYQDLSLATGHPSPDAARVACRRAAVRLARAVGRLGP